MQRSGQICSNLPALVTSSSPPSLTKSSLPTATRQDMPRVTGLGNHEFEESTFLLNSACRYTQTGLVSAISSRFLHIHAALLAPLSPFLSSPPLCLQMAFSQRSQGDVVAPLGEVRDSARHPHDSRKFFEQAWTRISSVGTCCP